MDGDAVESNAGEVFPREAWMGAFAHYPRFLPLPATKERGEGVHSAWFGGSAQRHTRHPDQSVDVIAGQTSATPRVASSHL